MPPLTTTELDEAPTVESPTEPACGPGTATEASETVGLPAATADRLSQGFKALADPTRIQLLALVAASPAAEACVCDLTEPVGLSQPTVSHHLKKLVDAGLLTREQRGVWAYYSLARGATRVLAKDLLALTGPRD